MPTKQELERVSLTELAVKCREIVDSPTGYPVQVVEQAMKFQEEWSALMLSEQDKIGPQHASLHARMVDFLVSFPPPATRL